MATLRRLSSGRWQATYRDASGKRHSRTWPAKTAAREWAADAEAAVRAGTHQSPRAGRIKLGEWYDRWAAARVVESATRAKNAVHGRYVKERWKDWPIASIERIDVQAWVVEMTDAGKGAETVSSTVRLLSAVLQSAVESNRIPTNVAQGLQLPTASKQPDRYLERSEVAALLLAASEPWSTFILVAAYTGLRWAEVAGLHTHRVDLVRNQLHVVEVVQRDGTVKGYPKSTAGRRSVPLTPQVAAALAEHMRDRPSGLVFTGRDGGVLRYPNFRQRVWLPLLNGTEAQPGRPARPGAGLADPQPTFHDLRHTYASWLVAAGVDLRTVQVRMGHESIVTTQRYAHLTPDADDRVLAALSRPGDADLALSHGKSPAATRAAGL